MVTEKVPMYPDMSTDEIRLDNQRMRDKANMFIEQTQKSRYYSHALESRKEYLRAKGQFHCNDLKFKVGERLEDPVKERARLVIESKELREFLNNPTCTVSGIESALEAMREEPTCRMLTEGMTFKEMSFKFKRLFEMVDDIKKLYEEHGLDPGMTKKSITPIEELPHIPPVALKGISQEERDQLISSYVQKIADTRYASIKAYFAKIDAKLEAMEREFRGF